MSLSPYSKLHAMVSVETSAKDCMLCNQNNPTNNSNNKTTMKQSQTIAVQG
jgi:hypothetical protein